MLIEFFKDFFFLNFRIKNPNEHDPDQDIMQWDDCSCDASQSDDLGIESMGDDLDFLDESCQTYRYKKFIDNF